VAGKELNKVRAVLSSLRFPPYLRRVKQDRAPRPAAPARTALPASMETVALVKRLSVQSLRKLGDPLLPSILEEVIEVAGG
jgi:hypothetical protein